MLAGSGSMKLGSRDLHRERLLLAWPLGPLDAECVEQAQPEQVPDGLDRPRHPRVTALIQLLEGGTVTDLLELPIGGTTTWTTAPRPRGVGVDDDACLSICNASQCAKAVATARAIVGAAAGVGPAVHDTPASYASYEVSSGARAPEESARR
jgi:hypothetical protein